LNKDYSYLDPLAGEVYGFVYDVLIHNMKREEAKEHLSGLIRNLNDDEKAYIKAWVYNAFDELRPKKEKKQPK
jgi:hypothetical protein